MSLIILDVTRLTSSVAGGIILIMAYSFWRGWQREPTMGLLPHAAYCALLGSAGVLLGSSTFLSDKLAHLARGEPIYQALLTAGWTCFMLALIVFVVARASKPKVAAAAMTILMAAAGCASYLDRFA